ncbi:hypothetical protein [Eikenella halliae]|uniref:hypothetical protein n=1 Tax=Eikenella halliae TaxID=1795832 RepID=UPI003620CC01
MLPIFDIFGFGKAEGDTQPCPFVVLHFGQHTVAFEPFQDFGRFAAGFDVGVFSQRYPVFVIADFVVIQFVHGVSFYSK